MAQTRLVHDTVRAEPVGSCIYCGAEDGLTDEHIVPFALGGRFVLPDASCRDCAAITSAFERRVLRGFMLEARTVGRFPTRRPKNRPKSLLLEIERDGEFEQVELAPSDHPGILVLPLLGPPGILNDREAAEGVTIVGVEFIYFGKDPEALAHEQNASSIRGTTDLDATSFARLLAKIAYGYAVAELGLFPRDEVPILPFILGDADDGSMWLGSATYQLSVEARKPTHAMSLVEVPDPRDESRTLIVARIKLFAPSGATGYEVLVHQPNTSGE